MDNIIAGRFQTDDEARTAAASLSDLVDKNDICIFFNNQPGAHDSDRDSKSSGDQGAAKRCGHRCGFRKDCCWCSGDNRWRTGGGRGSCCGGWLYRLSCRHSGRSS